MQKQKTEFRFQGIQFPLRFITIATDEEAFVAKGKKQFFLDKDPATQEQMLREVYKTGMDIVAENQAAQATESNDSKPAKAKNNPPAKQDDKVKDPAANGKENEGK